MYRVDFSPEAKKDLQQLQQSAPKALAKLVVLLEELREHPRTGTGKCERLKYHEVETWSWRITKEHRLVYQIHDDVVEVLVISTFGHYK